MNSYHENLLFCTNVCWLSKGKEVRRVYELREEIRLFLQTQNKKSLLSVWSVDRNEFRLTYFVDIFKQLNTLNLEFQGKRCFIIDFVEKIKSFINKMENWKRKIGMGNFARLETVSEIVYKSDTLM